MSKIKKNICKLRLYISSYLCYLVYIKGGIKNMGSKSVEGATKKCKHCQSDIAVNAKICPNCRKKQGMALWLKIGIGVVVLFLLVGIFGGSDEPTSTSDKDNDTENKEEKKKIFEQNEVVEYKGVKYSVVSVKKTNGSEYNRPENGKEFIEVVIKIENNSKEKISYNSYDWKMENSNGQELDQDIMAIVDSDNTLESGDLKPGGTVTGTLGFEQPKGDTGLGLNYYDNMFDDEYAFQIKIK